MATLDGLNARYGRGTVRLGSAVPSGPVDGRPGKGRCSGRVSVYYPTRGLADSGLETKLEQYLDY
jgi:hypothetical protein